MSALEAWIKCRKANDSFLTQVTGESTTEGVLLDLLLMNKLAGGVEAEGSFGWNPEIV